MTANRANAKASAAPSAAPLVMRDPAGLSATSQIFARGGPGRLYVTMPGVVFAQRLDSGPLNEEGPPVVVRARKHCFERRVRGARGAQARMAGRHWRTAARRT